MAITTILYSFTAVAGETYDLSPFFLTPGVADSSYQNLSWQLIAEDDTEAQWVGTVSPDGTLTAEPPSASVRQAVLAASGGSAPPQNFTWGGAGACNGNMQLQVNSNQNPSNHCPGSSSNPTPPKCCPPNPPPTSDGSSCPASPSTCQSVELATGLFVFQKQLLSVYAPGAGAWSFGLNYKANFDILGLIGKNFAYPQFAHLEPLVSGELSTDGNNLPLYNVQLVTDALSREIFLNNLTDSDNTYSNAAGNSTMAVLEIHSFATPEETYTLTGSDGTVTTFYGFNQPDIGVYNPAPGQIKSVVDRHGNSQVFEWINTSSYTDDWQRTAYVGVPQMVSATDCYGRVTEFSYYGAETNYLMEQVTDYLGRQIDFQYDSDNHLVAVVTPSILKGAPGNTFPGGTAYVFQYDVNNSDPARRDDLIKIWFPNQTQPYLDVETRTVDVEAVY
jgi:hypothetical protein